MELLTRTMDVPAKTATYKEAAEQALRYVKQLQSQYNSEDVGIGLSMKRVHGVSVWQVTCRAFSPEGNNFILELKETKHG